MDLGFDEGFLHSRMRVETIRPLADIYVDYASLSRLQEIDVKGGVKFIRKSIGRNEVSPRKRSKESRNVWLRKDCCPRPKKSRLPGCSEATLLGVGNRRASKPVKLVPVKLKNQRCPKIG